MKKTLLTLVAICTFGIMQMNAQITSYPYVYDFDAEGAGPTGCNPTYTMLGVGWLNAAGDDMDWTNDNNTTGSGNTGPTADHTGNGGRYMYLEASCTANRTAFLETPIFDLSGAVNPFLSLWYHKYGSSMGDLVIEIDTTGTGTWINLVTIAGQTQVATTDPWLEYSTSLAAFNNATNAKFRITGSTLAANFYGDMAIDDFMVESVLDNDAGIISIDILTPVTIGVQNVDVTLQNFGALNLTAANIEWSVDGVAQTTFPWTGNEATDSTDAATIGTYFFDAGVTSVKAWTALPNGVLDSANGNDTTEMVFCTSLTGTFTLGGVGADFATLTELGNILSNCGVSGNVIVNVAPGTYAGRLILDHIPGTSSSATVLINGGSADSVTFDNTIGFSNVYFDGADWTTIKNITLENLGTTDCYGVQLRDSAMNNTIDSCVINMETTATGLSDVIGVNASNTEASSFTEGQNAFWTTVSNCQFNGGEKGIHFEGQAASRNIGNSFINNTMDLVEDYGIYMDDQDSIQIVGNTITNLRNANADGIYLFDMMMYDISYNVVNAPDYGFYLSDGNFDAAPTSRGTITNNMISSTSDYGMYIDDVNQTDIFHNTVANISTSNAAFRVNDINNLDIRNNTFYSDGDFAFDALDPITTGGNTIDYNSYYTTAASPNLVDDGVTVHADLVSWQTAVATANVNSIEVDPVFVSATDLHALSPLHNDLGDNTVGILDDIDGEARPAGVNVDMGADEYTPLPVDAGIISIDNLLNPITIGVQNVDVTLRNFGALNLTGANIEWSVDGVAQTTFPWTGNLVAYATDGPLTIGTHFFDAGVTSLKAWTALPNGVLDSANGNDTTEMVFCTPLIGTYSLAAGGDFSSLTDLGDLLSNCGVSGNVIVNVAPGTYAGRLILDHIPGTSSSATVLINGGSADSVTFDNTIGFSNVYFDGADWTTIKNITLENLGTTDCYGVQLRDSAMNNTIDSCVINMETTATGLSDVIGVNASNTEASSFTEGQNAFWTTVSNCQFNGGEKGIHFEGQAASRNIGNSFINNTMDLVEDYGIYMDDQDSIQIVGNTITNLRNANADGIYLFDMMMYDISYNVVNAPDYGFYLSDGNFDAAPTSRGTITNNMISSTSDYGMYIDDVNQTDIFHNTVANISTSNAAFRVNDINNLDIRNNTFYSDGDFAFDALDPITTGGNTIDYNSYYTTAASPNLVDDGVTVHADLVSWQTAVATANVNSIEVDPVFVSATDLHALSPLHNDLGDNTVGILDDIDGEARPAGVNVDMGADEYTPLDFNAAFEAFVEPTSGSCGAVLTEVKVAILSLGAIPITSMPINVNVTGDATVTLPFTYTGSLAFNQRDTVTLGTFDSYFGLNYNLDGYVALAGDQDTSDDSLSTSVTIIPFEPRGIDGYACDGADTAVIGALPLPGTAYFWYDAATGGTQVGAGDTYTIPSITAQSTYYAEYANNSDSLITAYAGGNSCGGGNMMEITGLSTVSINAVSVNTTVGVGANIAVTIHYIVGGGSVANATNAAAWTTLGTYNAVSAGTGNPTFVDFGGASLSIPAGSTYALYVEFPSSYTNGNFTYANADLSVYTTVGLCSAFGGVNNPRAFNGTLHYGTTACSSIRTPVTVTLSTSSVGAFTFTQTGLTVDFDATTTTDADSVLWNFDDGNTSTSITPTNTYAANGTYNVCLYAYSNCGIDTTCQTVDITVGVEELNNAGTAKVFPNPSRGQFVLDLTNYNDNDVTVVVFNQLGKVVYNKSISNNAQGEQHAIDLSAYSNGIYFLKLTSDKEVTTKKIVIQK